MYFKVLLLLCCLIQLPSNAKEESFTGFRDLLKSRGYACPLLSTGVIREKEANYQIDCCDEHMKMCVRNGNYYRYQISKTATNDWSIKMEETTRQSVRSPW